MRVSFKNYGTMAAMAMLAGSGAATRGRLYRPRQEKYPGQWSAHLVGAWQPMTGAEIREHNARVPAKPKRVRRRETTDAD